VIVRWTSEQNKRHFIFVNLSLFLRYEIAFYWLWWLCFIAIGFSLSRYRGLLGLVASIILISFLIVGIEVHSVFQDMRDRPELGRDADGIFVFGMLCRLVLFNIFVLPASIVGLRLRARRQPAHDPNLA
jgi:hypothetical protein